MLRGRWGNLVAILVLALCALAAAWLDSSPSALGGSARASDGDSFRLGEERIRLLGIDAPELDQHCSVESGREWPCGREARERMSALLAGDTVECQPEDRDRYGRLLARCSVAEKDIAAILVQEGWALSSGDYDREQAAAKARGYGIWRGGFALPQDWRRDHARPSSFGGWLSFLGL